ncbi:sulfotransferase 1C4 [Helicoverpa armigera]|uniref:sulfotransferase 1C4 n=1 Tax=Helicoverpa armigera TaxID=29058 RepID=UPI003083CC69
MDVTKDFPWEIRDVEPKLADVLGKYFKNEHSNYVRVGPKGYFFPKTYIAEAANIYNMPIRTSDVFVASYPRSGSTWTRELVWIVANDWNFAKSETVPLVGRFMFLEFPTLVHPSLRDKILNDTDETAKKKLLETITLPGTVRLANAESPRFIYTHLPLSLLPPSLLDDAKVVYVARDPRDVAVSFYHMNRLHRLLGYHGDFKTFWNLFISNSIYWTPYFDNVKEAWAARHNSNMLFLFYEDMSKDLPSVIRHVASFLKKPCSEELVTRLSQHLSIDSFRGNKAVNYDVMDELGLLNPGEQPYIRKGKAGGWRDYFDDEMTQQAEKWIEDNLRDTDLRFPSMKY